VQKGDRGGKQGLTTKWITYSSVFSRRCERKHLGVSRRERGENLKSSKSYSAKDDRGKKAIIMRLGPKIAVPALGGCSWGSEGAKTTRLVEKKNIKRRREASGRFHAAH